MFIVQRLVRIKETMSENLSTVLRNCIRPTSSDSNGTADKESLTQCLRTYALIDQTSEAEKVITEDLLAPFMNKVRSRIDFYYFFIWIQKPVLETIAS